MHDDTDFPGQLGNIGDDEIEIEFVDACDVPSVIAPEADPQSITSGETGMAISDESGAQKIEKLEAELDHVRDVYLRKLAEFDNFRKRVDREREDLRQAALEDFVREILPVVDNFERALQHTDADSGAFHQGVEMIAKQLHDTLGRKGVTAIDPLGQFFDPEVHEAVQRVETGDQLPGTVVTVMLKGYTLGGRLIRPAMAGVAVGPVETEGGVGGLS
ncbi:MAG: nucleotide exchange factor GrpE [Candidatus Aminicenantes bacterium]|nr:MAG: nucleotide exchange factor GrpE [Candidatus Aminicenantes bacterium]